MWERMAAKPHVHGPVSLVLVLAVEAKPPGRGDLGFTGQSWGRLNAYRAVLPTPWQILSAVGGSPTVSSEAASRVKMTELRRGAWH
jgi:hypothetical protein